MKRLSKAFNVITDIIFFLVMGILIVYLVFSFTARFQEGVPSYFGYSYVRVMSRSMEASNIKKGDIVVLHRVKISELKVGDIIAYYAGGDASTLENWGDGTTTAKDYVTGTSGVHTSTIIFHMIGEKHVDAQGQTWFHTYGTSNYSKDANGNPLKNSEGNIYYSYDPWVNGDYVLGIYTESWVASAIKFISSTAGIIAIVIVPSAVVCLMLLVSMIDTIDKMLKMKKLAAELPTTSGLIEGQGGPPIKLTSDDEDEDD